MVVTVVLGVLLVVALCGVTVFAVRLALLKRSLRQVDSELLEIVGRLEDNRIVKLPNPDRDLEHLLETVNALLAGIRAEAISQARREAELKSQVEHISHDLRTPLTSIMGYLALVDDTGLDGETRATLATVRRKAATLQRLIAQFYELSRVRGGDAPRECQAVDIGRMVRESMASQYRLLAERGLEVRLDVPEHPVFAQVDDEGVERVVENLLHNAGKFAKTTLEVVVDGEGDNVSVAFANDVDPLDERDLAQLFQPFYTLDSSRGQESSGLGLTIARHLVEHMDGTLLASQQERDGTTWLTFTTTLKAR